MGVINNDTSVCKNTQDNLACIDKIKFHQMSSKLIFNCNEFISETYKTDCLNYTQSLENLSISNEICSNLYSEEFRIICY